jgi:hypothetical protein
VNASWSYVAIEKDGAATFSMVTFSIMTLGVSYSQGQLHSALVLKSITRRNINVLLSIDIAYYAECHNVEFRCAECRGAKKTHFDVNEFMVGKQVSIL